MSPTRTQLLRHHHDLAGRLRAQTFFSEALGIRKPFYVYEGPGLRDAQRAPLLVLLRGHEREWVNVQEDNSRDSTAIQDLDRLIQAGRLPPLLAVMPGLNSHDNRIPSLGIDMVGTWRHYRYSLGTGDFWTFLTDELLPSVDERYAAVGAPRIAVGFSLGGYTASLLALQHPDEFDHVALYDGLFMWPNHNDPREDGKQFSDPVWCDAAIFDPAFDRPRDRAALRRWNPTRRLRDADGALLDRVQNTTFWVACAAGDGNRGNRDRARFFVELLRERGVPLGRNQVVFHEDARHTWHWADRFLGRVLTKVFST